MKVRKGVISMSLQILDRPDQAAAGAPPKREPITVLLRLWGEAEQAGLAKRTVIPPGRPVRAAVRPETVRYATD